MNSIPTGPFVNATPLTSPTSHATPAGSHDLLADMRPAMDGAFAVGRPTDADGASAVLATGSSYLQGASSTLGKLDEGIARKTKQLEVLRGSDPSAAQEQERQLEMLQKLRDRVQLSIERVSDILSGKERDDIGGPEATGGGTSREQRRLDDLELLEQRRRLLTPSFGIEAPTAPTSAIVGAYAQGAR